MEARWKSGDAVLVLAAEGDALVVDDLGQGEAGGDEGEGGLRGGVFGGVEAGEAEVEVGFEGEAVGFGGQLGEGGGGLVEVAGGVVAPCRGRAGRRRSWESSSTAAWRRLMRSCEVVASVPRM